VDKISFKDFIVIIEAIETIKEKYTDFVDLYSMTRAEIIALTKKMGSDATRMGSWRKFYKYGRSLGMSDDEASRFAARVKDFVYGHSYWRGNKKTLDKIPPVNKNSDWPENNV